MQQAGAVVSRKFIGLHHDLKPFGLEFLVLTRFSYFLPQSGSRCGPWLVRWSITALLDLLFTFYILYIY